MRHFTHKELQSPDTHTVKIPDGFGDDLDALREAWGKPMKINSGCRSTQHNKMVGGKDGSYHIYDNPARPAGACAVDVSMFDSAERGSFVALAWSLGWSCGIAKTFIHVDQRTKYYGTRQVMFLY